MASSIRRVKFLALWVSVNHSPFHLCFHKHSKTILSRCVNALHHGLPTRCSQPPTMPSPSWFRLDMTSPGIDHTDFENFGFSHTHRNSQLNQYWPRLRSAIVKLSSPNLIPKLTRHQALWRCNPIPRDWEDKPDPSFPTGTITIAKHLAVRLLRDRCPAQVKHIMGAVAMMLRRRAVVPRWHGGCWVHPLR